MPPTAADIAVPAPPPVRLRLVGAPALLRGGVAHALERKDAALLALLALEGATSRARLAAWLWPGAEETRARNSLRQRLFRLRRLAGADLVEAGERMRLAPGLAHDLEGLRAQLEQDPDALAGELLGDAVYDDLAELASWVDAAREAWRQRRREARTAVAEALEAAQRLAEALRHAERLVAENPALEHAHRRLMRLHYLRGDRAAALAAYEAACRALHEQLDAEPGAETRALAALVERGGAPALPVPRALPVLRPPRLVGRDAAWAQLQRAHDAARVLLVEGEPGIGKTRLLTDFAQRQPGAVVVDARPGDAAVPYALAARVARALLALRPAEGLAAWVREELARLAPELGPAPAHRLERVRLQRALCELLSAAQAAGLRLPVVDDLQFADPASLELLPAWVAAEPRLPWLLGARPGDWAAQAGWPAPAEMRLDLLPLGPLTREQVAELLQSLQLPGLDAAAWAEPLARHTGGNPMYVLETLRALLERGGEAELAPGGALPAPLGVAQLIERRLQQLSPAALRLARAAAVAGGDFDAALAGAVLGRHPLDLADAWRELEAAHVIRGDAFAHDLILEVVRQSVPGGIARGLHEAVAQHLQARGAPPARLAQHWEAAQRWPEAAAAWDAAAQDAAAASRGADEARLREQAARCHERAGSTGDAFASRLAGMSAVLATRGHGEAEAAAQRLREQARSGDEHVAAMAQHANVLLFGGRAAEAEAVAREALALASPGADLSQRLQPSVVLAMALTMQGQAARAFELLEPLRAELPAEGDPRERGHYWHALGFVCQQSGRWLRCAEALGHAMQAAEALGDLAEQMVLSSNLSVLLAQLGRGDEAAVAALRAHALRDRLGDDGSLAGAQVGLHVALYVHQVQGRYAPALQLMEQALASLQAPGAETWRAHAENVQAAAWLELGQAARAQRLLGPLPDTLMLHVRARRLQLQARLQRLQGRSGQAPLDAARALLGPAGEARTRWTLEIDASRELDPDEAVALCAGVAYQALRDEHRGIGLKALAWHAEALLRAGRTAPAADEARALVEGLARHQPLDTYLPEALWIAARALQAAGDAEAAAACRARARRWVLEGALPQVPESFREAFLHRQPVNRALLAGAA